MKNVLIAVIITVILVGSGSFYAGMKYDQSKNAANNTQQSGQQARGNGQGGQGGAGANGGVRRNNQGGFVNGEILSKDDKSITVKLQNGGSKIILLSGSTTIGKTTDGTIADVAVGKNVMVSGTANADGTVTAQSIQIRPAGAPVPGGTPAATSTAPAAK